jgi:hypothetical protein
MAPSTSSDLRPWREPRPWDEDFIELAVSYADMQVGKRLIGPRI